jgi:hypothetical protein
MLLKKKNLIILLVLLPIGSVFIISCSKGNSPVTDDTVNPPDPIDNAYVVVGTINSIDGLSPSWS